MSDQNPHVEKNLVEKNRVEKNLEDVLTEARRVLSHIDDLSTGFAANQDTVELRAETWWLLSELAGDAKRRLDAAADALPGSITVTRLDDWAGLTVTVVTKPVTKPAA